MPQTINLIFTSVVLAVTLVLAPIMIFAEPTSTLKSIPITLLFETVVARPNHLTLCNETLWTFSESNQNLVSINPQTGKIIQEYSLNSIQKDKPIDTAALACQHNHFYILINSKKQGQILELQVKDNTLITKNQFSLPQKSRATDLFCNSKKCWVLQDKPFVTNDLKKWSAIEIPIPHSLKKAHGHPELDPFEDWQASLILAKGGYAKGAVNSYDQTVLLDLSRSQAVVQKGTDWTKWGSFGAWEGSFLSPKAMTFVSEDTLAIADTKLKSISLFSYDGIYLGVLAWNSENIFSPEYTLGLASDQNRLFIADFEANKIIALDINKFKSIIDEKSEISIRKNLFRREIVLKDPPSSLCLKCHDGTVSNQLYKYIKMHFHHPLECSQCHDPHHSSKESHFLRKPEQELCQSCHKDFSEPKTNHVWLDHNKKGGNCIDCHRSHADAEKLLVEQKPQLCLNCHKDFSFRHNSVQELSNLEKSKNVFTQHGSFVCQTCHQTHINWKETHFIKAPAPILNLCSSCHGDKAPRLFKNFHKLMKTKKRNK